VDDRPAPRRLLRLAGVVIVGLWVGLAIAVAVAYRPGGQLDLLVAIGAVLPVPVAAASVAWPAVIRSPRDLVGLAWIWLVALLLTIPLMYSVASSLTSAGPQRLVPSAEVAYGSVLALGFTAVFSLLGPVHRRAAHHDFERRASLRAAALAVGVTAVVALVFGGLLVLNQRTLQAELPAASRYGPTDPAIIPPECTTAPRLGRQGRVAIGARLVVDGRALAEGHLDGRRDGRDEVWAGGWSGVPSSSVVPGDGRADGRLAYRRVGPRAWLNEASDDPDAPGTTWHEVGPDPFGLADPSGLTMDGPPRTVLGGLLGPLVTEDLGFEVVEGARARHCRTFVDGPTSLAAFLPLRWLVSGTATSLPTDLTAWRGELDWWVFGDGELGRAAIEVSGLPSDAWAGLAAIEGMLRADLDVTDRTRPTDVTGPLGTGGADGSDAPVDALESAAP
jgi:hypothetical protein